MRGNATPGMRLRRPGLRRGAALLPLAAVTLLSGCVEDGTSFLTPHGPVAALQRYHLWEVTLISMIVVLPVLVGVPLLAWRYRYGNAKARYTPEWDFSHTLEWVMWVVPALIVLALGALLWIDTHKLDPYRPIASAEPPLRVQVVGLDWKWLFIYPDYHIATVGQMAFPQDRPVSMQLTTDTVMQSFTIPALAGQIYAMPGMQTKLNFKADKLGKFEGMNTQFTGDGFDKQHFTAVSMSKGDFDNWVKSVQDKGVALNQAAYAKLSVSSTPAEVRAEFGTQAMPPKAVFFNNVAPGFYMGIMNRYMKGTTAKSVDQPGSVAYNAAHS
ncbi:cytochrome ubiquinol oxidase subunit II [Acidimangrovimonas pyrenivorans]|uniref:Ubiquinol oxidase subunit 2 n=1 Tax=Acidimangrovimonas pyrenivorans TaxID=2030798 RepID=A0ABV7AER4_9RHOB